MKRMPWLAVAALLFVVMLVLLAWNGTAPPLTRLEREAASKPVEGLAVTERYDRGAARPRYPKSRAGLSGEVKVQRVDPKTIRLSYTLHDAHTHAWWFRFPIVKMTVRYWGPTGQLLSETESKFVVPEEFERGSSNTVRVELKVSPPDNADTLSVVIHAYGLETAKTVIPKQ